ncbi:aquaporin [Salinicoccus siamensis]|uniref:aquaporin n=1 Tax=Salinicoccus siamensis TaxID=381830 RepID=UPI00361AF4FF
MGGTTGYAINPARDLGPRFLPTCCCRYLGSGTPISAMQPYRLLYPIFGPLAGGALGAAVYNSVFLGNPIFFFS